METLTATQVFETLSSGIRLEVFRLLVRFAPNGLVAGEIATKLNLPATNLSFHLKNMAQAGVISATQEGRFLRYRANLALMNELITYLTDACCAGDESTSANCCSNTNSLC